LGATAVIGLVDDISFLENAFRGADAVYTMVPPRYDTADIIEYYHGIGNNLAEAIVKAGIPKVVNLSSWGANHPSGCGPVTGLYFVEQALNKLQGVDILHLRPGYFYTNLLHFMSLIKNAGIIGSNYSADTKLILVDPRDIAVVAAEELISLSFKGKGFRYIGSDEGTLKEITSALGNAIGKPGLRYVQFGDEEAVNNMMQSRLNENMSRSLVELGAATRNGKMIEDYLKHAPAELGKTKLGHFANEFSDIYSKLGN
jgi:uncharacterized protein YbjT (DUF2867 family)